MLKLDRRVLAQFLPNPQAIAAFEQILNAVGEQFPATIEEAATLAAQAQAGAAGALALLMMLSDDLQHLALAPGQQPQVDPDNDTPRQHLGTISEQNHDAVHITGGTVGVDEGAEGRPTLHFGQDPETGFYRSGSSKIGIAIALVKLLEFSHELVDVAGAIRVSKQITSTLADGTPPLVVASGTKVENLNADKLDDKDWSAPAPIGTATPAAGTFTTIKATDGFGCNGKDPQTATPLGSAATDLASAIALVNTIRTTLIANGICS